jgi:hypothetical protein
MDNTTRLDDLPVHSNTTASSIGQPMGHNVVIQQYDPNVASIANNANGANGGSGVGGAAPMDQRLLQELVSGVQRASSAGMTALPSRDIPRDSLAMQHDEQIKPNYIPQSNGGGNGGDASNDDYIKRYETSDDVRTNNRRSQNRMDSLEAIYTEFQMPILLGVLYFIFQMPVLRTHMLNFIPALFNKDANLNLIGLVAMSSAYAVAYYVITKLL